MMFYLKGHPIEILLRGPEVPYRSSEMTEQGALDMEILSRCLHGEEAWCSFPGMSPCGFVPSILDMEGQYTCLLFSGSL